MSYAIVSGAIANKPMQGGEAWVRLSWALGLKRLGFDVCFAEQIARSDCVDAAGWNCSIEESVNKRYFDRVTRQFGLTGSAALIDCDSGTSYGLSVPKLLEIADAAAVLVNISGNLTWQPLVDRIRHKAYVDIDPGFTQFWDADSTNVFHLPAHDSYFTIGENIGQPDCPIPTADISWRPTRQPVVLDDWPVSAQHPRQRFTTIANWRGPFGPVEFGGKTFGLKVHEFRKFIELPQRSSQHFEIALNIDSADQQDLTALRHNGWTIADPNLAASTPDKFRRYVQESLAEFSPAQGIYVDTHSSWFSDRTVRYLASGKPALVQDTGFGRNLPIGEGLLAFRTLDEAVAGAEAIAADYEKHARTARWIAEEFFDSDKVLTSLLQDIGVGDEVLTH